MKAFLPILLLLASLLAPAAARAQVPAAPTVPDSLLRVTASSCKWARLAWTKGNGQRHALVLTDLSRSGATPNADVSPLQHQDVSGSDFFGTGGATQNFGFAVYTDTGSTVAVRNLIKGHVYRALLFPYNVDAVSDSVTYLMPAADTLIFQTPNCPNVAPSVSATNLRDSVIDCSTIRLSCSQGNGAGRLFVIRKSTGFFQGDVSVDNENYLLFSKLFARGFQTKVNSECYAVYAGPGSSVTVYGLAPDQLYKWAVYEYNTVPGPTGLPDGVTPIYKQDNVPFSMTTTPPCVGDEPHYSLADGKMHQTRNAALADSSQLTANSVRIKWHPSVTPRHFRLGTGVIIPEGPDPDYDGEGHYVVIHNTLTSDALPLPVQNTTPFRSSTVYGQGSAVRPGMDSIYSVKVTYDWRDTLVTITGLRPATTYTANIFTFRFPRPILGSTRAQSPFTYYLSSPQAAITFTTKAAAPLPVSLVSFQAAYRANPTGVLLSWRTASELNNAGFGVERSLNGRTFTRLAFVTSTGGTSSRPQDYSLASPYVGAAYYRLRQQDLDGKATFSPVVYMRDVTQPATLAVFPNPTTSDFRVVGADVSQPVEVFNLLGTRVLLLLPGVTTGTLGTLPGGVYVLRQGAAHTRLVRE